MGDGRWGVEKRGARTRIYEILLADTVLTLVDAGWLWLPSGLVIIEGDTDRPPRCKATGMWSVVEWMGRVWLVYRGGRGTSAVYPRSRSRSRSQPAWST